MEENIAELIRQMATAVENLNFEEARRLRDQINLIRGGASAAEASRADTTDLLRQQPGAMGIGTNHPRPERPAGWKVPPKPDLMTSGRRKRP
jgi:hypothetical protein